MDIVRLVDTFSDCDNATYEKTHGIQKISTKSSHFTIWTSSIESVRNSNHVISFGTTVGAKTISIRTACVLATIFESFGAILLGAKVGETIRKNIFSVSIFEAEKTVLMIGMVSSMIGSVLWQVCATFLKMPVSEKSLTLTLNYHKIIGLGSTNPKISKHQIRKPYNFGVC